MSATIRTRIVKIGNSQGIRIPKLLLEQSGIYEDVEIEVAHNYITIRPVTHPRLGWGNAFAAMADRQDDRLLDDHLLDGLSPDWDQLEWDW
jgi:antitoxin MazE